ncbi:hypothetical protein [Gemmatimonas sp.]|uniref:hypothetical protein n=1 Tax=Gemmatimonas sp. TaxID=1962908 RepID=UPI0035679586
MTRTFLDGTLPRPLGQKSSGFVVDEALFTVSELAAWRDLVFDAVNNGQIPSAVSLDLDERLNRVCFVMDGPETIDQARAAIVKLGVPAAALSVERGTRPVDATASTTPNSITDQDSVIVGVIGTSGSRAQTVNRFAL